MVAPSVERLRGEGNTVFSVHSFYHSLVNKDEYKKLAGSQFSLQRVPK